MHADAQALNHFRDYLEAAIAANSSYVLLSNQEQLDFRASVFEDYERQFPDADLDD